MYTSLHTKSLRSELVNDVYGSEQCVGTNIISLWHSEVLRISIAAPAVVISDTLHRKM